MFSREPANEFARAWCSLRSRAAGARLARLPRGGAASINHFQEGRKIAVDLDATVAVGFAELKTGIQQHLPKGGPVEKPHSDRRRGVGRGDFLAAP